MADRIRFYGDEHIPRKIADGLKQRGCDFVLAVDLDMMTKDDDEDHLPFAASLNAVIVTFDRPFAGRTLARSDHAGLVCWTGAIDDIGGVIDALAAFAEKHTPADVRGKVFWLKRDTN